MLTTFLNIDVWLIAFLILHIGISALKRPAADTGRQPIELSLLRSRFVIVLLVSGAAVSAGSRIFVSLIAPGEFLQDTLAAREFLNGRSIYPRDFNRLVVSSLEKDRPPLPLAGSSPWLQALQEAQLHTSRMLVFNAHPPLLALMTVPLVKTLGVYTPMLVANMATLAALPLILHLLREGLQFRFPSPMNFSLVFALIGWQPVLSTLRHSNQSVLICALVILAWFWLKRRRALLAGLTIALAASLKAYPGLIILPLLVLNRRAFVSAVSFLLILALLVSAFCGWNTFPRFLETAQQVKDSFGQNRNNYSLLSAAAGLTRPMTSSESMFLFIFLALLLVFPVLFILYTGIRAALPEKQQIDLGFALFACMACLLSPTAWSHYFSLLVLPFAVLARYAVRWRTGWLDRIAFFSLLLMISFPDQAVAWFTSHIEMVLGTRLGGFLGSLPTLSMLGILFWLSISTLQMTAVAKKRAAQ